MIHLATQQFRSAVISVLFLKLEWTENSYYYSTSHDCEWALLINYSFSHDWLFLSHEYFLKLNVLMYLQTVNYL